MLTIVLLLPSPPPIRTEMREPVPPIMNDKIIQLTSRLDESLVIPCVAYASPRPTYHWELRRNGQDDLQSVVSVSDAASSGYGGRSRGLLLGSHSGVGGGIDGGPRLSVRDGTLLIGKVRESDAGQYYCTANNTEGTERLEVQLDVVAPLTVHVQPMHQTIDLGKPTELVSSHLIWSFSG